MESPCYDGSSGRGSSGPRSPAPLVQLAGEAVLARLTLPPSWAKCGNDFSLEVFCQAEILGNTQISWRVGTVETKYAKLV